MSGYPWYEEARRLIGTREIAGSRHSPIIMGWVKRLSPQASLHHQH